MNKPGYFRSMESNKARQRLVLTLWVSDYLVRLESVPDPRLQYHLSILMHLTCDITIHYVAIGAIVRNNNTRFQPVIQPMVYK